MLVDGEWVPTFPNARYIICRERVGVLVDRRRSGLRARPSTTRCGSVIDAGLADLVPPDHKVTDDIRLELTPGHTPGHVAVRIESNGEQALITGDLAHHPVQFAEPSWAAVPDTDTAQSEATRRRLLAEHANTSTLVIGTHFAPPCAGLPRDRRRRLPLRSRARTARRADVANPPKEYPIRVGSMLFVLTDPGVGHEVEYNRWYERDHIYAGCMIGPWFFAGGRWVATRALKDLRLGEGLNDFPIDAGSYMVLVLGARRSTTTTCSTGRPTR